MQVPDDAVFSLCSCREPGSCPPPVEWWFIHGWYEGSGTGRRFFMCTFFRFFRGTMGDDPPLCHLLVTDYDLVTGRNEVTSQADPAIPEFVTSGTCANLDPDIVHAYRDELRESGVPAPMVTGPAGPSVSGSPFMLRWGEFSLTSGYGLFLLNFIRPGDHSTCRFTLAPVTPAWYCPGPEVPGDDGMAYASLPRLAINGTAGGSGIRGEAWADHQWGGTGWFQHAAPDPGGRPQALGWDWYAVTLSSGTCLMLLVHREMSSRRVRSSWGIVVDGEGTARPCPDFFLEQDDTWTSPVTGITYPVSVRITIPAYDCTLRIDPLTCDQEVPVPGPMRAVWEGAARVHGMCKGRPVEGDARVELCGYGYIFDLDRLLSPVREEIDRTITGLFPASLDQAGIARMLGSMHWEGESQVYTDMIAGPVHDLMQRAKKYYRPLYALLLMQALGVDPEPYVDLICTIPELTHTGALIIDDIEDNSRVRRGGPCIHLTYGVDTAINAANMLYYLPWLLVEDHPHLNDNQRLLMYRNMVRTSVRAHMGQAADIYWSHLASPGEVLALSASGIDRKVLQMHADKTGVAGEQVANGCCIIARTSHAVREACIRFSREMWIAFQVVDDIRDVVGGRSWHKVPGGDIAGGKMSYVIAKALVLLTGKDRERLAVILAMPPGQKDDSVIREAIALVTSSGAVDCCRGEVAETVAGEWERFSPCIPASEAKVLLRAFCQRMLRE